MHGRMVDMCKLDDKDCLTRHCEPTFLADQMIDLIEYFPFVSV